MKIRKLGHATLLLELGDARLVFDPWLGDTAENQLVQREEPAVEPGDLPEVDAVLATCAREDRLHPDTLKEIGDDVPVFCPAGSEEDVEEAGAKEIRALDIWEDAELGDLRIIATPALLDEPGVGWLVIGPEGIVFYGGDSARDDRLFRLAERFEIDVACVPIPGTPHALRETFQMTPDEAVELCEHLGAKVVVPVGHGLAIEARFSDDQRMALEPRLDEFEEAFEAAGLDAELVVLAVGEDWSP